MPAPRLQMGYTHLHPVRISIYMVTALQVKEGYEAPAQTSKYSKKCIWITVAVAVAVAIAAGVGIGVGVALASKSKDSSSTGTVSLGVLMHLTAAPVSHPLCECHGHHMSGGHTVGPQNSRWQRLSGAPGTACQARAFDPNKEACLTRLYA